MLLSSARLPLGVCVFAAVLAACPRTETPPPPEGDSRSASRSGVVAAAGDCVLATARAFVMDVSALSAAVRTLEVAPDAAALDAARGAFKTAMRTWQQLEVMQLGPHARRPGKGALDLRDHVYSWPLVSRCAVEEQLVSKSYEAADFGTSLLTRRGLDALEYLLFHEGEDTACAASSKIVAMGTWAALTPEERAARKRAYAVAVMVDVTARAASIVEAWAPEVANFLETLKTAGQGSTLFPTSQAALNAISDAIFYVETETKDMKLAKPLGLRDCETESCPELLESRIAGLSKQHVRANVEGAQKFLEGCGEGFSGTGFDDLLEAYGATELAGRLKERTAAVYAAIDGVEEDDLEQALAADKASVRAVHDALKGLTDLLKNELTTVLDLELPQTIEGDND